MEATLQQADPAVFATIKAETKFQYLRLTMIQRVKQLAQHAVDCLFLQILIGSVGVAVLHQVTKRVRISSVTHGGIK